MQSATFILQGNDFTTYSLLTCSMNGPASIVFEIFIYVKYTNFNLCWKRFHLAFVWELLNLCCRNEVFAGFLLSSRGKKRQEKHVARKCQTCTIRKLNMVLSNLLFLCWLDEIFLSESSKWDSRLWVFFSVLSISCLQYIHYICHFSYFFGLLYVPFHITTWFGLNGKKL